ncbi:MAG: hypothetical protein HYV16_10715 [Gammaproteobacteria bacterium]|nr:hypothetical protein [Gammaproteobacteria bacterium]
MLPGDGGNLNYPPSGRVNAAAMTFLRRNIRFIYKNFFVDWAARKRQKPEGARGAGSGLA